MDKQTSETLQEMLDDLYSKINDDLLSCYCLQEDEVDMYRRKKGSKKFEQVFDAHDLIRDELENVKTSIDDIQIWIDDNTQA